LRAERGNLSRPTVAEIYAYRQHVDLAMQELLRTPVSQKLAALIELGLQHEQQHQELLLTDIKFILGTQALMPAYATTEADLHAVRDEHGAVSSSVATWLRCDGGVREIGHTGKQFAFDNEMPQHAVYISPCEIRNSLVSNAEYLEFMRDGGYQRFEFWHAEGWDWVRTQAQVAPLYWHADPAQPGSWLHYTLGGMQALALNSPVTHISYYEAYAFCQWAGWRLPTEFEWEVLSGQLNWGQRWEWTESAYLPYPGFRKSAGAVGEYNGKFMVNQKVLRGASYATPAGHARNTYRNFFHPYLRWQYTGIRPARDPSCSD
jgi:ergothioneine biosynthesis protein EgtB